MSDAMMENSNRVPLYGWIFLVGMVLKQFYTSASGSFQLGDFCIILSFGFLIISGEKVCTQPDDSKLKLYIFFVAIINGFYSLVYSMSAFLYPILYYIFNLFVIIIFEKLMYNQTFLIHLERICKLNILIQLFVYMTGRGRWYMNVRYQGTFNDPNQLAFFLFTCFLMILLIMTLRGKAGRALIWLIPCLYLLVPSASTGMFLGYIVLIIAYLSFSSGYSKNIIIAFLVCIAIMLLLFVLLSNGSIRVPESVSSSFLYERIVSKILSTENDGGNLLRDRGWTKVFDNLYLCLYGAGEGYYTRFNNGNEVHSSILGPLFYYGIIPFSLYFSWCKNKVQGIKPEFVCIYMALIVESVFLVNTRQPIFWMLFVFAGNYMIKKTPMVQRT